MNSTIGRWLTIAAVKSPWRLLVSEHVIFVFAGHICIVGVLVENEAPRMIETTALNVNPSWRPSVSIVTIDLITIGADNVKVPIMEHKRTWLTFHRAKFLQERPSRSIVDEYTANGNTNKSSCIFEIGESIVLQRYDPLDLGNRC